MLYEWKENSMLTNCFAACAHLPITVCEIERNICEKNPHFIIPPLHSTPPLGGSRRNIGTPFGMEKLEWCRYPTVKKFRRYVYSFWRDLRTWQTDRQTLHDSKDHTYASRRAVNMVCLSKTHNSTLSHESSHYGNSFYCMSHYRVQYILFP